MDEKYVPESFLENAVEIRCVFVEAIGNSQHLGRLIRDHVIIILPENNQAPVVLFFTNSLAEQVRSQ